MKRGGTAWDVILLFCYISTFNIVSSFSFTRTFVFYKETNIKETLWVMVFLHPRKALPSNIFHLGKRRQILNGMNDNRFQNWLQTLLPIIYYYIPVCENTFPCRTISKQTKNCPSLYHDFIKLCVFMFRYWDRLDSLYGGSRRCDKWNIWLHKLERRNRSPGVRVNLYNLILICNI